jgi:hypothetical protein
MTEHSKEYKDKEEFRKASLALTEYQRRHNNNTEGLRTTIRNYRDFQG